MIGSFLRHKRRSLKETVTQQDVCKRLTAQYPSFEFTRAYLSNIENGKSIPNVVTLTALCNVLDVTDDDLPELFKAMCEELEHYEKRKQDL